MRAVDDASDFIEFMFVALGGIGFAVLAVDFILRLGLCFLMNGKNIEFLSTFSFKSFKLCCSSGAMPVMGKMNVAC